MLYETAQTFLGVPFKHQGRDRSGLDCVGLVIVSARLLGVEFPDVSVYSKTPSGGLLQQHIEVSDLLMKLPANTSLQRNDIALFRFNEEPQHVGIVGDGTLIHSYSRVGKVVEHRFSGSWKHQLVCIYRLKENAT